MWPFLLSCHTTVEPTGPEEYPLPPHLLPCDPDLKELHLRGHLRASPWADLDGYHDAYCVGDDPLPTICERWLGGPCPTFVELLASRGLSDTTTPDYVDLGPYPPGPQDTAEPRSEERYWAMSAYWCETSSHGRFSHFGEGWWSEIDPDRFSPLDDPEKVVSTHHTFFFAPDGRMLTAYQGGRLCCGGQARVGDAWYGEQAAPSSPWCDEETQDCCDQWVSYGRDELAELVNAAASRRADASDGSTP